MSKAALKEFTIPFIGLKHGITTFNLTVDDTFFKEFGSGEELISGANVQVELKLDKRENMIVLNFGIEGTVKAACDRCLNELDQPILDEFVVYVKFSGNADGMSSDDDDVIFLPTDETHLHLAEIVHDLVLLSIPMQKGCLPSEVGGPQCNKQVLEYLNKQNEETAEEQEDITDQRWAALEKLKSKDHGTS